jgi:hypothetical protein
MPDDGKPQASKRIDEPQHILGEPVERVGGDPGGLVGQIVAALVGGEDAQPGSGQPRDLMPPAVPEFRKPMQQDDQWPIRRTRGGGVQPDAVGRQIEEIDIRSRPASAHSVASSNAALVRPIAEAAR